MQFMVLTRRRTETFNDADYSADRLEAEAEGVRALYADGLVRQIWLRGDIGGACLLVEAASEGEVRNALERLPLFAARMQEIASLVPLRPYRGFGPRVQSGPRHAQ